MILFLLACQSAPQSGTQEQKANTVTKMQSSKAPVSSKAPAKSHHKTTEPAMTGAPPATPVDRTIDSSSSTVLHPPPLDASKHQRLEVCPPYYQILEIEARRATASPSDEPQRLAALRNLNRHLGYHPSGTALALVELEKESLVGPIHLSLDARNEYWGGIHSYIGALCRVDLSEIRARKQEK